MTIYKESNIELSNGIKFRIWTTIPKQMGNINSVNAALDSWLARTYEYTEQSFVDYINSKGYDKALTNKEFEENKNKLQVNPN